MYFNKVPIIHVFNILYIIRDEERSSRQRTTDEHVEENMMQRRRCDSWRWSRVWTETEKVVCGVTGIVGGLCSSRNWRQWWWRRRRRTGLLLRWFIYNNVALLRTWTTTAVIEKISLTDLVWVACL